MKIIFSCLTEFFLTIMLGFCYHTSNAQTINLPEGYSLQKDGDNVPYFIQADFNSDGKNDFFAVVKSKEQTQFLAQLSPANKPILSQAIDFESGKIVFVKNDLSIRNLTGMRFVPTYKFRFEQEKASFRLIGYDAESYGNAVGEGSGTASFNLLTGAYENAYNYFDRKKKKPMPYPKTKAKFKLESIYLAEFGDKAIDKLLAIDSKNAPKGVY
jgi:hypothetical protein